MRLLVVGCGSIGKRHVGNFKTLGVEHLGAVDTREDRRQEVVERLGVTSVYKNVDEALAEGYDAVLAGIPTRFHVDVASKAIAAGAHVLIEKPLSDTLEGVDDLIEKARSNGLVLMVGYTYRFWPPLRRIKELLDAGAIGRVYSAQITFSEYLPDWHPWEDYRSWFMARKDLGGGAILDESHAIDISRWLFGDVAEVLCVNGTFSHLEITADDLAEMILVHRGGTVASVHMDIFGREHRKQMAIIGESGNIAWDFYANTVTVARVDGGVRETLAFSCDRNDMFLEEARCFLDCIEGRAIPPVDGTDGRKTLELIVAALDSSQARRAVRLVAGEGRA